MPLKKGLIPAPVGGGGLILANHCKKTNLFIITGIFTMLKGFATGLVNTLQVESLWLVDQLSDIVCQVRETDC